MNDLDRRAEKMLTEQYIEHKKMSDRDARRFRLIVRRHGYTIATMLKNYNPVPYNAMQRHLGCAMNERDNKTLWRCHMEMADYFLMIQKQCLSESVYERLSDNACNG